MAVSEVAGSTSSGKSSKSARSRNSHLKCCDHPESPHSSPPEHNLHHFYLSNTPLAQSIRARAAIYSIVISPISALPRKKADSAARTGDVQTGLARIFDKSQVKTDVQSQLSITQQFGQLAPKAAADYAGDQAKALRAAGNEQDAKKWDEGGAYRVVMQTVIGALGGGAGGALGAGAVAAAAPLLNDLQSGLESKLLAAGASPEAAKAASKLVGNTVALGLGSLTGGTAGVAFALNVDANNRQLHPSEKQRIGELARQKAKDTCKGSLDCERSASIYWSDMLQSAAEVRVDSDKAKQNTAYYNQVVNAAGIVGSEASVTGASVNYFNDLKSAQQMLNADAGKPILMPNSQVQLGSDGKPQTYFSATEAQKADAYLNVFPGGSPNNATDINPGKALRDQDRLARLTARNGSAQPDTTLEEVLFGVRLPVRGTGAVVQSEKAALVNAEKALISGEQSVAKLDKTTIDSILSARKGSRPDPATYLSQDLINSHLSQFDDGVTKFASTSPSGVVGPPGGTFVMPKSAADNLIKEAGGDVAKLERLLSLEPGTLGVSPVRIDIASPSGLRMSSGNELGANKQWLPGGYTGGGIPEATVNSVRPGAYVVKPTF